MIDIDNNIFQTIVKFVEGELSTAEHSEVEQQLKTDTVFKRHYDYYEAITGAIGNYAEQDLKAQLKSWHQEGILPEEEEVIKVTLDHDRRRDIYRKLIWTSILALLLAAVIWEGYRLRQTIEEEIPTKMDTKGPVAVDEAQTNEDEDLFGAPGDDIIKTIPFTTWSIVDGVFTKVSSREKSILISATSGSNRAYLLKNDSLQLFSYDPERLENASLEWRNIQQDDQSIQYLLIEEVPYRIIPGDSTQWLGGVSGDVLLEYFPDLNNQ